MRMTKKQETLETDPPLLSTVISGTAVEDDRNLRLLSLHMHLLWVHNHMA